MSPIKTRINLQIDDTIAQMLLSLKSSYPIFGDVDIIKLAINDFYIKHRLQNQKEWSDSLPTLNISKKQKNEINQSIASGFDSSYTSSQSLLDDILMN